MNTIITIIAAGLALWAGISVVVALTLGRAIWIRDHNAPRYHRTETVEKERQNVYY